MNSLSYNNFAKQTSIVQTPSVLQHARAQVKRLQPDRPLLFFSESELRRNSRAFIAAMPRVHPHFAVKANPHPRVLAALADEGTGFEIASKAELELLLRLGIPAEQLYYSNPIKAPTHVRFAAEQGVRWFVVDSVAEVQKIAAIAPAAKLYLRITTSNAGAVLPLAHKFGCNEIERLQIMQACSDLNLTLAGVSFHVGSQCIEAQSWRTAIDDAKTCFVEMQAHGFKPELLNIGGGYPTAINDQVPSIEHIASLINAALADIEPTVKVIAEPGRHLVASAGCLSTQVVGTAKRGDSDWLYLDTGYYGGLMELADHYALPISTDRKGALKRWTVAGPTCDSIDVCCQARQLPAELQTGDRLFIGHLGAYCYSCTTDFNGFPPPELYFV